MMYKIMVVEDELIERLVLKKTIEKVMKDSCRIYEAENGKQALELVQSENINIIISDISMPGMNGIELVEKIRKHNEECCIIFLTAHDNFDYAKKAIPLNIMEYLLKPYSTSEIVDIIEKAKRKVDEKILMKKRLSSILLLEKSGNLTLENLREESEESYTTIENISEQNIDTLKVNAANRLSVMISMVEEYITANYMQEISMGDVARALNYSEPYFCKVFKMQFGKNFTAYLTEYRIKEAVKILRQPNINVKDVGTRVGYKDNNYFTKVFKKILGMTPSEYQMLLLEEMHTT